MAQSLNQFKQTMEQGVMDMRFNTNVISCQIDPAEVGTLVPGQAVKIVNSASGVPQVTAATADTDNIYGFITFEQKKSVYKAGDVVDVAAMKDNVMYMTSSAAIARDAQVMVVIASKKVATAAGAGKRIVGRAFDKASGADELIRVVIELPGAVVP